MGTGRKTEKLWRPCGRTQLKVSGGCGKTPKDAQNKVRGKEFYQKEFRVKRGGKKIGEGECWGLKGG